VFIPVKSLPPGLVLFGLYVVDEGEKQLNATDGRQFNGVDIVSSDRVKIKIRDTKYELDKNRFPPSPLLSDD
jgi:hypothetical protein